MTPGSAPELRAWLWDGAAFAPCAGVPPGDRGFRHGMSVFESLRVVAGRAQFLDAHLDRLRQACFQREFAADHRALGAVADALAAEGGDGFARVYVTAGDGAPAAPAAGCRVFLFLEAREPETRSAVAITMSGEPVHPLFGGLKTANTWANIEALRRARAAGFDDTLLFNERAELVSASTANVFIVRSGEIRTPALSCGARNGTIRAWVRSQASVVETSIFPLDVMTADEIFLTNCWLGVMPVATLDGRALASTAAAARLLAAFSALPVT